jgi:hypothetical protein
MRRFFILIAFLVTTTDTFSQIRFNASISKADSLSIELFWNTFRTSIQQKDKQKLASLFKFPFYCHQCLDYVQANDSYNATVKVSKQLLLDSVYKLFFDIPILNKLTSTIWSDTIYFHKIDENKVKSEWAFSYAIIAPTKEYEGSQGFIYIRKRKGKYVIDGLDTVP